MLKLAELASAFETEREAALPSYSSLSEEDAHDEIQKAEAHVADAREALQTASAEGDGQVEH